MEPTPPAAAWNRAVWPLPSLKVRRSRYSVVTPLRKPAAAVLSSTPSGSCDQPFGGDQAIFGVGPGASGLIDDAVADLEQAHALTDGIDHPGRLGPGRVGHLRGFVDAGAVVDVDEIDADRGVTDAHLPGAGLGQRHLDPLHDFRSAVLLDPDRMRHYGIPSSSFLSVCAAGVRGPSSPANRPLRMSSGNSAAMPTRRPALSATKPTSGGPTSEPL